MKWNILVCIVLEQVGILRRPILAFQIDSLKDMGDESQRVRRMVMLNIPWRID